MNFNDDLFVLIQSLSRGEKRAFQLSASAYSGDKAYLKLFKAIEKQKKYDEGKLKKKFREEPPGNQLSANKIYLFNLILDSLSFSSSEKRTRSKISKRIDRMYLLFERNLEHAALKETHHVEKMASDNEEFWLLAEVCRFKIRLIEQIDFDEREKFLEAIMATMLSAHEKAHNFFQYIYLHEKFTRLHQKTSPVRNETDLTAIEDIFKSPLLMDVNNAKSLKAKYLFYLCHYLNHYKKYDMLNAYKCAGEMIRILNTLERGENYVLALFGKCECEILLGLYGEALGSICEVKQTKFIGHRNRVLCKVFSCIFEMQLYVSMGNFYKALHAFSVFEKEIENNPDYYSDLRIMLLYLEAIAHFGNNNLPASKKYLLKIINDPELTGVLSINQYLARIMYLIVLYETGDMEYLSHQILSVYRYLVKHNKVFDIENILLNFLRKELRKNNTNGISIYDFREVKKNIEEVIAKKNTEKVLFEYFDLISWLESKIEGKSFAEVIRNKAASFTSPA